jgi:hypothetical protein
MPLFMYISNIVYTSLLLIALSVYGWALVTRKYYIRILFIYLALSLVLEATCWAKFFWGPDYSFLSFHIFTFLEYTLVSLVYIRVLSNKTTQLVIKVSIPIFFLVCILFHVYIQKINSNDTYATIIGSLLILCWTLLFLREVILFNPVTILIRYPLFWINTGIMINFTETLLIDGVPIDIMAGKIKLLPQAQFLDFGAGCLYLFFLMAGGITEVMNAIKKNKSAFDEPNYQ